MLILNRVAMRHMIYCIGKPSLTVSIRREVSCDKVSTTLSLAPSSSKSPLLLWRVTTLRNLPAVSVKSRCLSRGHGKQHYPMAVTLWIAGRLRSFIGLQTTRRFVFLFFVDG